MFEWNFKHVLRKLSSNINEQDISAGSSTTIHNSKYNLSYMEGNVPRGNVKKILRICQASFLHTNNCTKILFGSYL